MQAPLLKEDEALNAIYMGITGGLKIYAINTQNSMYHLLTPGDLEKIRQIPSGKKANICFRHPRLNTIQGRPIGYDDFGYEQKVGMSDLWVNKIEYEITQKKTSDFTKIDLSKSLTWCRLEQLVITAIEKYPTWKSSRKSKSKIKKTSELKDWLLSLGADAREALIMSKVLSEFFEELK